MTLETIAILATAAFSAEVLNAIAGGGQKINHGFFLCPLIVH